MRVQATALVTLLFLLWAHPRGDSSIHAGVGGGDGSQAGVGQQPQNRTAEARKLAAAGEHKEALDILAAETARLRDAGNQRGLADAELARAVSLRAIADTKGAAAAAQRARALAATLGDDALQVRALTTLGRLAQEASDNATFAALFNEALPIAERTGDARLQISVLSGLASVARLTGDASKALDYHRQEIAVANAAKMVEPSIRGLTGRATTLLGIGRYDEALVDSERAHELAKSAPANVKGMAGFSLAQVHAQLWNLERAAELWDETIANYKEAGLQIGVALSLRQSMETWFALGELDKAAASGNEALRMFEKTGSGGTLPDTLARMALIEARRGNNDAARAFADRARVLTPTLEPRRRVFLSNDLGLVALQTGDPASAERQFSETLSYAQTQGDHEYEWRAYYGLGRVALTRGDGELAERHLDVAARIVERLRKALPDPAQRATFMTQRGMVSAALVDAVMLQSTAPDDAFARRAFEVAEAARARALADQLAEARARATDPEIAAVQRTEAEFAKRFSSLQKRERPVTAATIRSAPEDDVATAEREYESLVARVRRENPRYAALAWPEPLRFDRVIQTLRPGEALLAYHVGDQGGWGWAVRDGKAAAFRLPARSTLDALVREAHDAAAADDVTTLRRAGATLAGSLITPADSLISGAERLIVIPDASLHRLSFAALPVGDGWLIERHAVTIAPSATVLADVRARDHAAPRVVLAFAAPLSNGVSALPQAADEAEEAAELGGALSEARVPAREEDAKGSDVSQYRLLHFASHATVDERVPRRTAIVLGESASEDGRLQVSEIPHLRLNADVVVLAACRTQMGRLIRGEGLVNLTRAFLQAGTRSVVATLWDVRDASSRRLMREFYRHLADGHAPDAALRKAQLAMLKGSNHRRPSTWAAFVLTGDASRPLVASQPERHRRPAIVLAFAVIALTGGLALAFVRGGRNARSRSSAVR